MAKMTLYEIDARIRTLADLENDDGDYVDPETGEVMTLEQALDALHMAREDKLEGMAVWAKELEATAKAIKAEEDALIKRRRTAENKMGRLKAKLLTACMGENGVPVRFTTARADVQFRLNQPSTIVYDESLLPERYKIKKITVAPDKTAIKEAIRAGEAVPGAYLERSRSVMIK